MLTLRDAEQSGLQLPPHIALPVVGAALRALLPPNVTAAAAEDGNDSIGHSVVIQRYVHKLAESAGLYLVDSLPVQQG